MRNFLLQGAAAGTLVMLAAAATRADSPPLKVGVDFSFTGPSTSAAAEFEGGIAAWVREHGDTVAGRKIVLVRRDDTGPKPDVAKRNAQELVVGDRVDLLLGAAYTPTAIAVAGVSTQAKKPFMILNAATSNIMKDNPYSSRFGFTTQQVTPPLAQWALRNGIKSTYLVFADYGPGIDAGAAFDKTFTAGGGKILGEARVPMENSDFSAYVQRIKDAKPDAVFVFLPSGPGPGEFLKAFVDAGLKKAGVKLLATGDLVTEDELDSMGDEALGIVSAYDYSIAHNSALNRQFVKDFSAAKPGLRPNFEAVAAYDLMHALSEIVAQQNGNIDPDKTMQIVAHLHFESPRGPIRIDSSTRDIVQNVYIRRTEKQNGKLVNVEIETVPMVKDPTESY